MINPEDLIVNPEGFLSKYSVPQKYINKTLKVKEIDNKLK